MSHELTPYLSLNQTPDILALCETNLDGSCDSGNFFVRCYVPLIRKNSSTHIYGLAVYAKEGLPFAWNLSLEHCRFLLMFSTGFTSFSVLIIFRLSITFFIFVPGF